MLSDGLTLQSLGEALLKQVDKLEADLPSLRDGAAGDPQLLAILDTLAIDL